MPKNGKRTENEVEERINKRTLDLKKYDEAGHSREEEAELEKVVDKLLLIGKPAVSELIKVLNNPDDEELPDWIGEEYDPEDFNAEYVVFSDPDDHFMFDFE